MERLVDEARAGVGGQQGAHAPTNLVVGGGGEALHHDRHGPRHVVAYVGSAYALARLATEEAGIVVAPHEASRVLVDGVGGVHIAHVAHAEERRHVGVVHEELVAEAVDLIGVDLAILGVVVDGVGLQRRLHLGRQVAALPCARAQGVGLGAVGLLGAMAQDLGGLVHGRHRHEVGRHEERQDGGVVGRPEHGGDEAHGLHGRPIAIPPHGVEGAVGHACEMVSLACGLALLLVEGGEDVADGVEPVVGKHGVVARDLPIVVGQTDGIAVGVDLILALEHLGPHLGAILLPPRAGGPIVVGVGVAVDVDALHLSEDDAAQHAAQALVLVGERHIGVDLRARVAQPHGGNVAGIDEGVVVAIGQLSVMDGALEGVGEAVGEHPCELGVVAQHLLHLAYLLLHGRRGEEAGGDGWAFRCVLSVDGCHHLGVARVDVDRGVLLRRGGGGGGEEGNGKKGLSHGINDWLHNDVVGRGQRTRDDRRLGTFLRTRDSTKPNEAK